MIPKKPKIALTPEQEAERAKMVQYINRHGASLVPYSQQDPNAEDHTVLVEGVSILYNKEFMEIDISANGNITNNVPDGVLPELQEYILKYIKEVGFVYLNPFFKGLLAG